MGMGMIAVWVSALLCGVSVLCSCGIVNGYVQYNTGSGIVGGKLNVHLVPHSHDDVGWLKTVDQYYVGSNNSIQGACVENVLDSVVMSLGRDPNKKFVFAEMFLVLDFGSFPYVKFQIMMYDFPLQLKSSTQTSILLMAFFQRWWQTQNLEIQEEVRKLVDGGQLEFINGGWCMHDEATCHYIDMIDQTTLGHRSIKNQFNKTPRAGWQIDPFGHSAVQAYLLGAELGFDSVHFARIDYQDRAKRKKDKSLEVVWQGSKTFGSSSQANVTLTNHIMWTMGDDFQYQYAESWFKQMDKLIHYVNKASKCYADSLWFSDHGVSFPWKATYPLEDITSLTAVTRFNEYLEQVKPYRGEGLNSDGGKDGRVNALYSTPSIYTDAKHAENESWLLKIDDYFPYADSANAYWTGFFTSRPALKRYVRMLSGYYLATRQLEFLVGRRSTGPNTFSLADALGIAQHHDAVTGTAKQHTTNDYAKRLAIGASEAEGIASSALSCLVNSTKSDQCPTSTSTFSQCQLLNISFCPPTEEDIPEGKSLVVVAYNPLGWNRTDIIKIP
ncbi:unnamed protein product, partial [Ilex paraguariensis]